MIEENSGVIEVFLAALKWIFDHQPFISFKGDLRNRMSLTSINADVTTTVMMRDNDD